MKKNSDFPFRLNGFLTEFLPKMKNVSTNTIASYCDTFKLFITYLDNVKNIAPEKISMTHITTSCVEDFLTWLEAERQCAIPTRNQRLAALRSFMRYAHGYDPGLLLEYQKIREIPSKKYAVPNMAYLSKEDIGLLLRQPDIATSSGRRDQALLALLYDSGARVQEICDLRVRDVRLFVPASVRLNGKGRKQREVPLSAQTAKMLDQYIFESKLTGIEKMDYPLFFNARSEKLTRAGVTYILKKHAEATARQSGCFPQALTPHILRHTKAMHLLEANVTMLYIRDILGHADVATTSRYARANLKMKQAALEKLTDSPVPEGPSWLNQPTLLSWLKEVSKGG